MGVTGAEAVNRMLASKFAQIERIVRTEVRRTGDMVRRDANLNASGIGFFDSSGNFVSLPGKVLGGVFMGGNGYQIWVDAGKMAAYIEFGTGVHAAVTVAGYDAEWRELAYTFYVNGKGHLKAHPYLYPAWIKNTTGMVDRMRSKLKEL